MSTNYVEVVAIDEIKPHPNADKLELAIIKGLQTAVPKGTIAAGQVCVFFPPDMLIPEAVSQKLGVQKYLKHSTIGGFKCQCRVAATRLRYEPSFGFVVKLEEALQAAVVQKYACDRTTADAEAFRVLPQVGENVDELFGAEKYEPPVRFMAADAERDDAQFHKYTSIEHYWRFPDAIADGTLVRITEKIHGTNSRVGVIRKPDGEFEFMAGSHRVRRKNPASLPTEDAEGNPLLPRKSLYWSPLSNGNVVDLLTYVGVEYSGGQHSVILFGEIYGGTVQDMDYGVPAAEGYRVFDISLDGKYLDWTEVKSLCERFSIELVPVLYEGPFNKDLVKQFTYGPTTLAVADEIKTTFKDREGCVITPQVEQFYAPTGGRLIVKSVSADYLDRRGAQDNE